MTITFQIDFNEDANLLDSLYTYVVCSQHYSEKEQDAIICNIFRYLQEQNIKAKFEEPLDEPKMTVPVKLRECYDSILSNESKLHTFINIMLKGSVK